MSEPIKYKRRQARNTFGDSHYLTFSTWHKRPYLADHRICEILAKSINKAAIKHNFAVQAYVFMPDHVHLLLHPLNETYSMEAILKSIKQGPSQSAKFRKWIDSDLWERGGGHDSNLTGHQARAEVIAYIHQNPVVAGLVEDPLAYRWSSCNWFVTDEQGDVLCCHFGTWLE